MSLANTVALLADTGFRARVQAALTERAAEVVNETTGSFPIRASRIALASSVLIDPSGHVNRFASLCADDAAISASATSADVDEADIRRVVETLWSAVAAVTPTSA